MPTLTIEVQSRVIGNTQPDLDPVLLELVEERITAAELIRRTVEEQVRDLTVRRRLDAEKARQALARQYLTAEEVAAQAEQGRVALPAANAAELRAIEPAAEVARAWRAFEAGRFHIFAGGRQVERLDEVLDFTRQARVTFLRLTPLMGG